MFEVNMQAIKEQLEYLRTSPLTYNYPHQSALDSLFTALPASQIKLDFLNHLNSRLADLSGFLNQVESLSEKVASYDGVSIDEVRTSLAGSFEEEFASAIMGWQVAAQNPSNHASILTAIDTVRQNEIAAFNRAQEISNTLMTAMAAINTLGSNSPASKILNNAIPPTIKNVINQAQSVLSTIQALADFGFSLPPPGQEFQKYLKDAMGQVQSALQSGAAKIVDGAITMVVDGVEEILPVNIVNAMITADETFKEVLNKLPVATLASASGVDDIVLKVEKALNVENTIKDIDSAVYNSAKSIQDVIDRVTQNQTPN